MDSCSTSDSVTVIVFPLPIVDAGEDTSICSGLPLGIGTSAKPNHVYNWSPGFGLNDSTVSNPIAILYNTSIFADTVSYLLTETDTITGCSFTDTIQLIVWSNPDTTEIFGSVSICPGADSISYWLTENNGSVYLWTINGPGAIIIGQGSDSILINWDTANVWTIEVIETDSNGCNSDTSKLNGETNPILEPVEPTGPDSICSVISDSITYTAPFTFGSNYNWFSNGGSIVNGNGTNTITVNWDSLGTGHIWYIESSTTSDTVCTGISDSLEVYLFQSPISSEINGDTIICNSQSIVSYTVNGLTGSEYIWTLDGDTIANGINIDSISLIWDSVGTFIISVSEIAVGNCSNYLTDTIIVYETPETTGIYGDTAICYDSLDYMYFVSGNTGSNYTWIVNGGSINSLPLNNDTIYIQWDSIGLGEISTIEISDQGCLGDTLNHKIDLFEVPTSTSILGDTVFCEDTIANSYILQSLMGSMVTWLINGDTITSGINHDTLSLIWDSSGTYILTSIEITPNGCSNILFDTITVFDKPETSAISGSTSICFDSISSYEYSVIGLSNSDYNWIIEGGTIISTPITNDTISVHWDTLGTGTIYVVEISASGCLGDTIPLIVNLNEIPNANSIIGDLATCQYSSAFSYTINGLSGSTYLWEIEGATNIIDDSSNSITVTWDTVGIFTIEVIEISSNGCLGDTIDTVMTVYPFPTTQISSGDTLVCAPANLASIYSVNGDTSSQYIWNITGGNIINGQGSNSVTIDWDSSGIGTVSVVEITADSCLGDTVNWPTIVLDSPSLITKVVSDGEIIDTDVEIKWDAQYYLGYPDSVNLFKREHFSSNNWTFVDQIQYTDLQYIESNVYTSDFSYEYKLTGKNACKQEIETNVHNTILLSGSNNDNTLTINLEWNTYNNWKIGVDRYEIWRKLDNEPYYSFYFNANKDTSIKLNSGEDGLQHCFRILAHEENGYLEKSWSNELCVEFEHLLHIPTVISPNGNGLNDTWKIDNIEYYPDCLVQIYNRWGMMVFKSNGYPKNWDGTSSGGDLPMGVYYYVIDIFKDGIEPYTGSVSILHRDK